MAGTVLEAKNLVRTYGTRRALDDVSVTINEGEMVALIGPSGSGKSTLLRSSTGLILTDKNGGEVSLMGISVQKNGELSQSVRQARSKIGFVFQQFNLVGRLSLFENIMLGALGRLPFWKGFFGQWSQSDKELGMKALARVGIAEYAGQRANLLSGGQQQRGAIARALVQGAKAIFLDEPVASLDPVSARKVMELLEDLNKNDGVTVAVVLHQIDYAIKFCDRIIALKSGKIVYDGPKEGLVKEKLIEIYGAEYDEESGGAAPLEETVPPPKAKKSSALLKIVQWAVAGALLVGAGFSLYSQMGMKSSDINFSILATENSQNAQARWKPFIEDMRKQTGLNIKPYFQSGYAGLVQAVISGNVQVGWFSNKPGWEVVKSGKAEVFVRSADTAGYDGYTSILIAKSDSKITLDDVLRCDKSIEFGMGDASSTSGTLAPMAYLFAPKNINPNDCFKVVRSASHEANFQAVAGGLLPVATNNSTSLQVLGADNPEQVKKVKIIWESPRLPEDPIIWRKDLDPVKKEKIKNFFLNYGRQGDEAQQKREREILKSLSFGLFQPANDNHFIPVREMEATEALVKAQNKAKKEIELATKALEKASKSKDMKAIEAANKALIKAQSLEKTGEVLSAKKALEELSALAKTAQFPQTLPTTPTDPEKALLIKAQMEKAKLKIDGGQK